MGIGMRQRYRLYRRKNGGRYYIHDDVTGKQESLGTGDRVRYARRWRLGITLGVCMSGFET